MDGLLHFTGAISSRPNRLEFTIYKVHNIGREQDEKKVFSSAALSAAFLGPLQSVPLEAFTKSDPLPLLLFFVLYQCNKVVYAVAAACSGGSLLLRLRTRRHSQQYWNIMPIKVKAAHVPNNAQT